MKKRGEIDIVPVTAERWHDLAALFETNAVTRNCWCTWFQQKTPDFRRNEGAGNRRMMQRRVRRGPRSPGLLAYLEGRPAAWCAVAPRDEYPRILNSTVARPIDDRPAWSIVCFFVAKEARGSGVMRALIEAAVEFAAEHGATLVESYPVDPAAGPVDAEAAYHGLSPVFAKAGFREAARRSERRVIMRRVVRRRAPTRT